MPGFTAHIVARRQILSLFCAISVLRHIIFITSHLLHVIFMQATIHAATPTRNLPSPLPPPLTHRHTVSSVQTAGHEYYRL